MLQIPNPDEEEFLGSLRKRADSVTSPPSLSPDAIKKQLPERPKITLTRRLAPFAAAAACLALILTGTYALKNPGIAPREHTNGSASSAETVAIYDEGSYMLFAAQTADYSDIYQMVTENSSKAASSSNKKHTVASSGATDSDALYTLTESGRVEQDGTVLFTPEFPEGGSWKPVSLLLSADGSRLCVLSEGAFDSGTPSSAALLYDLSDPAAPKLLTAFAQTGSAPMAAFSDNTLLFAALWQPEDPGDGSDPETFVPGTFSDGFFSLLLPDQVEDLGGSTYLTLTALDPNGMILDNVSLYGNFDALILTENGAEWDGGSCPFDRSAFQTEN